MIFPHFYSTSVLAVKAGLPTYKCDVVIRNPTDRKKLDAKECPECKAVSHTLTYSV